MTIFKRTLLAEDGVAKVHSEALGNDQGEFSSKDIGALVKMGANSYVQVADGDEIGGSVTVVQPHTVNDGYSFGSVKKSHRISAVLGADADTNAVAVTDLVVADVQPALGSGSVGTVKKGTPALHKWQVIWLSGAGAAGDTVILERV